MSTTDPTHHLTVPAYAPTPPAAGATTSLDEVVSGPPPSRRRVKVAFGLLLGALVLLLVAGGLMLASLHSQHSKINDLTDRNHAQAVTLHHTQNVLADTKSDLGGVKAHLAHCQPLGAASRHLLHSAGQLSRALTATTNDNFFTEMDALDQATSDLDAANQVAINHGYSDLSNMIVDCDFVSQGT